MAGRLATSDKGFYGGIGKLADKHRLVKAGGLLYAAAVAEKLKKKGSLPDMTAEVRQRSGSGTALVLETLKQFPLGLSGQQVKEIVGSKPEAPKSIREHGQYIYNVLATLMGTGQVIRDADSLYKFAGRKGEANGADHTVGFVAHAS